MHKLLIKNRSVFFLFTFYLKEFFMSKSTYEDKKHIRHSISEIEDVTTFISSYFAWLTLDKQKQKAKEMIQMTKGKEP